MKEHTHKEPPSSKEAKVILIFLCSLAHSYLILDLFIHEKTLKVRVQVSLLGVGFIFPQEYCLYVRGE